MANISHRLGKLYPPSTIPEMIGSHSELSDTFQRCDQYLRANGVNLNEAKQLIQIETRTDQVLRRNYAMLRVLLDAGLRAFELCELELDSYDYE